MRKEVHHPAITPSPDDPGALLSQRHRLPSGADVRLRLAHIRESDEIRALLSGAGDEPTELGLHRLLRHDPRRRLVLIATIFEGVQERIVGIGTIRVRTGAAPDVLAVAPEADPAVAELLQRALTARAAALASRAA